VSTLCYAIYVDANHKIAELLRKYPLVSDQVNQREVEIILTQLDRVLQSSVPGHVVEFGCYTGTTSLFLQRWLALHHSYSAGSEHPGAAPGASYTSSTYARYASDVSKTPDTTPGHSPGQHNMSEGGLGEYGQSRELHVYDSFEGLPEKSEQDQSAAGTGFEAGKLNATKSQFIKNFRRANLPLPIIHKAWFSDLDESDVPSPIAFAFFDGFF
jgi:O-methyltransferase